MKKENIKKWRKAEYPIAPYLLERWSPRSMTEKTIEEKEFFSLLEAARWAPSSYNEQPWIILYAKRDTPHFQLFFDLLVDFNKLWVKNAAYLLVFLSRTTFEKNQKSSPTHSFDTGAAWENLALQASAMGLVAHGMSGFDFTKAGKILNIPKDMQIEAMAAIGKRAPKEALPKELEEREFPSSRKPISSFIHEGPLP